MQRLHQTGVRPSHTIQRTGFLFAIFEQPLLEPARGHSEKPPD